jgi:formate C-acetyltransferase
MISMLIEGSMETGIDVSEGGSKYHNCGVLAAGLSDTADSLAVIKRCIFEDKTVSISEFADVLKDSFRGYEYCRQMFINKVPKFGNDIDFVDDIAKEIAEYFCHITLRHRNVFGGVFKPGFATPTWFVTEAKKIGASANGRFAMGPYGVNLSSSLGMDKSGPTALIRSVTKIDLRLASNCAVVNLKFNPSTVSGECGLKGLTSLVKSFVKLGGYEIMFDVVSKKTLIEAQRNPVNYQNLLVRIWGCSVRFVDLPKEFQEHVIARSEH